MDTSPTAPDVPHVDDPPPPADAAARRARWIGIAATVLSVVVVHGANVGYRLFYDDYYWLDQKPDGVGAVFGWFVPDDGASIYRPLLHAWFQGMQVLFGQDPLPYHLFALATMVGAALAVRWFARELGLANLPATAAGIIVGAHASLAPGTLWASDVQTPIMLVCAASAMAFAARRRGLTGQLCAAGLLALAITARDVAVMVPVIAALLLVARDQTGPRVKPALTATASLWIVGAAYGLLRVATGAFTSDTDAPYRMTLGSHVVTNYRTLVKHAVRFGLSDFSGPVEEAFGAAWHYLAWLAILGLTLWAVRKRSYLPIAGVVGFFVGVTPVVGISHKGMDWYYIDLALVSLAIGLAALIPTFRVKPAVVVALLAVFVVSQVLFMQAFQARSVFHRMVDRTDQLEAISERTPTRDGVLVIEDACPLDEKWTKSGTLFRILRDEPDLEVRFELAEPGSPAAARCPRP